MVCLHGYATVEGYEETAQSRQARKKAAAREEENEIQSEELA